MLFQLLVVAAVAGCLWWYARRRPRQARHARGPADGPALMPYEDLPPVGAFEPLPPETEWDSYVAVGIELLSSYLTGRDQTA